MHIKQMADYLNENKEKAEKEMDALRKKDQEQHDIYSICSKIERILLTADCSTLENIVQILKRQYLDKEILEKDNIENPLSNDLTSIIGQISVILKKQNKASKIIDYFIHSFQEQKKKDMERGNQEPLDLII